MITGQHARNFSCSRGWRSLAVAGSVVTAAWLITAGCHTSPHQSTASNRPATQPTTAYTKTTRPAPLGETPAEASGLRRFNYHAIKLGSDFNLVFYAQDQQIADRAAAEAYKRVEKLDAILSDYRPDSELSRLNQMTLKGPMTQPAQVSVELGDVLALAIDAAKRSDGVFDPTIGPFVQLWRRSRRQQQLPSVERIDIARNAFGFDKIEFVPRVFPLSGRRSAESPAQVRLKATSMRLDLGGIAGGYIAQEVLLQLKREGIDRALIDCSGDIAVGNPPPGREGWRIAIQDLTQPDKTAGYIEVANCGVSTSGDTYRFVLIDGVRYSHIVDPKTGLGLTHSIGVTTIAPDATTADWMATAISVMGREKGLQFVEKMNREQNPGHGVRITTLDASGKPVVSESAEFAKWKSP